MQSFEAISVPINRRKMIVMTTLYGIAGLAAFLFIYYFGAYQTFTSHTVFKVASVVVLIFFAIVAGTFAKNIKNQQAGFHITAKGIDDQTSSISAGLIPWKEITAILTHKSPSSQFLLILVKHPEKVVNSGKNGAVKRVLEQNLKIYKTPIVVNAGALTMSLTELEQETNRYFERFGTKKK